MSTAVLRNKQTGSAIYPSKGGGSAAAPAAAPAVPTSTAYGSEAEASQKLNTAFAPTTPEQKAAISNASAEVGKALLVTSNAARNATASNVSKLQAATSTGQPSITGTDAKDQPEGSQPVDTTIKDTGADTGAQKETKSTVSANEQAVSTIADPGIRSQFKDALDNLDTQAATALANVKAARATLANDPAAAAAVDQIESLYNTKISLMKERNKIVMGRNNTSVAAFGGLGPMGQNFLSDQEEKAQARVTDLETTMKGLVLKAQIAYKQNDTKALNDAMKDYEKAGADKLKAINDLLTEAHKSVTEAQATTRLEQATTKAQLANDISLSTNVAASALQSITDAGITDQGQIDEYLNTVAEEYGITNPDILRSAFLKAKTTKTKDDLSIQNSKSIINKRGSTGGGSGKGSGKDGGYSYSGDDIQSYTEFLNKGGTGPNGTVYAGRGKNDQYVDPGAYTAALQDWVDNGGTPQGFVKKFPVSNVNPASHSKLPAAIRPKTKAATPA